MVQKLRHLWGRVEIRVLVLLVFGFLLAGLALAVAQLAQSSSDDDPQLVSSWDDLIGKYLDFRAHNYPLVVPTWFTWDGQTEAILKEYDLEALQQEPDWYWNFDGDVFVFDDNSPLATQVKHGTRIIIYEDMVNKELVVLSAPEKEGGDYREEVVYRAPAWPKIQKGEDYERYLWRELSQRQIVWQVTLKSKSLAGKEAAELAAAQAANPTKDSGEGGGMRLMMGMEEYSNHLWVSIQGPAQGLTNLEIAAHIPDGFTNRIEVFACTNLIDFWWTLAATNILTEGTDTVYWTYETTEEETGPVFVAIGNADIDSDGDGINDAREKFLYHTDAELADTDGDGVGDGEEVQNGTSPTNPNDPPNVKGTILYGGQQTNVIRVLAVTDSNSWSLAHSTTITNPGPYQIANLPSSNYYVKAFRDLDNDGSLGTIEARGESSGNPVEITAQVTGVDITLTEPDTDGDGFTDYEELYLTGTSPTNAEDGADLIETTRADVSSRWDAMFPQPLVFTNEPGSAADLNDIANALSTLNNVFNKAGPQ